MKRERIFTATMVMLLFGSLAQAGISELMNGSFEDDGRSISDITLEKPKGWDVNMPADRFGGWIYGDWVTEGSYNLTLLSYQYSQFEANDIAMVSQDVYLTDVNEIVFDLKVLVYPFDKVWDPNKRSAVVLIDNVEVWNSDDREPDINGEYRDEAIAVDVVDTNLHRLSLGIRADVNEAAEDVDTIFYTLWDDVKFNVHCNGFGFLFADLNRDCYVDWNDLKILTDLWLAEIGREDDANAIYNWYRDDESGPYGVINFRDYAVFAGSWDGNLPDLGILVGLWLAEADLDDEWDLYRGDDADIINFRDYAVFASSWNGKVQDLGMIVGQWLVDVELDDEWNLYRGDDVYPPGIINFRELAIFAESWMDNSYEQDN